MSCNKAFLTFSFITFFFYHYAFTQQIDSIAIVKKRWLNEKSKGFYNVTTFSLSPFRGPLLNGMQTICGYKFNPHFALGGGIGLERYVNMPMYDTLIANLSLMPVFVDLRYTILSKKVSPVIAVQGGYKVLLNIPSSQVNYRFRWIYPGFAYNEFYEYDEYTRGGLFFSVEAGARANICKRSGIYLGAVYSLWSVSGTHHYDQHQYLPDSQTGKMKEIVFYYPDNTLAYTHIFLFRIGFGF